MANEAVLVYETSLPVSFTVSDSIGIEKGTVCVMSDLMTAAAATLSGAIIAGILAEEKIALDGKIKIPIYRSGIFKVTGSGTITVGDAVGHSPTANIVQSVGLNQENILGIALETAANAETLLIELKPMAANLA